MKAQAAVATEKESVQQNNDIRESDDDSDRSWNYSQFKKTSKTEALAAAVAVNVDHQSELNNRRKSIL